MGEKYVTLFFFVLMALEAKIVTSLQTRLQGDATPSRSVTPSISPFCPHLLYLLSNIYSALSHRLTFPSTNNIKTCCFSRFLYVVYLLCCLHIYCSPISYYLAQKYFPQKHLLFCLYCPPRRRPVQFSHTMDVHQ